ncbi:disease resistance protein RPM1-like [Fagus crenata]
MAETVVSPLIDRLISLLTEEAKLLRGIRIEVAVIEKELKSIQFFLKDEDARSAAQEDTSGVKTWVEELREVAFRIDVAIDEYLLDIAQHRRRGGFIGFFQKITHLLKSLKPRHKIATEIQDIKASVQEINERTKRYGFQSTDHQGSSSAARNITWHDPRMASLFLDDTDVVGIETSRDELLGTMVGGSSNRTVISVVGMGGLGKTTLAKKVYDDQTVRGHFDCHAWILVSQSYHVEDLLRSMIKQFCEAREEFPPKGIDSTDKMLVINKAREYLQEKRYVVVFDDVWEIDFWGEIEHALPDNVKGSRIMITTRDWEVANFCRKSSLVHVHMLQQLPPDKAWELFCKKAFHSDFSQHCPSELKKLSRDIVEKCNGSPLAIVAIGGLLATKDKSIIEWKNLLDNLGIELEKNPHLTSVTKILSLSYEDLPYNLKTCFLYLGMYPVDCSINCVSLIRQWIAEGFVEEIENKTSEEVARQYLIELIHRSLVQVAEFNFDGKVRRCRLHDLFCEIALQKMKDLSFCGVLSKEKSIFKELTRRLSTGGVSYNVLEGFKDKHIHSLLLFNVDELPKSFMNTFFASFKLLRVMDFEDAPLSHIPKDVGSLFHLRYLSLRNTAVRKLPKSIGKLQNLETLDLKKSLVSNIPVEINKLRKLRHLIAYRNNKGNVSLASENGIKIQKGIGCLEDLQKLCHVEVNHGGVELIEELGKLRQLRKLGLKKLTKETMKPLCASIEKMDRLESLAVTSISEDDIIDLQSISSPPPYLQRLYIKGCLDKLPLWISNLQYLVRIHIFWSKLSDDPLETFQNLPSLLQLTISNQAYIGEKLHFKKGGFPKLKNLRLKDLNGLYSLIIDEGALPLLEWLLIGLIPQLKEVPSGIQHLRNLKELRFLHMPEEFKASLDPKQGPCYWIIEHVPIVLFHQMVSTGYYNYETSSILTCYLEYKALFQFI